MRSGSNRARPMTSPGTSARSSGGCTWPWRTTRRARLSAALARRHAGEALAALDLAVRLTEPHDPASHALLSDHRPRIESVLAGLSDAAGAVVLPVHGDLHVGQVLRGPEGYAVVDFDGNPTRSPALRAEDAPAACDVAGMLISLENVSHVARHSATVTEGGAEAAALDWTALAWTSHAQGLFLSGYRRARRRPAGPVRPRPGAGVRLGAALPRVRLRRPAPAGVALRPRRLAATATRAELMDADLFLADLEEKPARLAALAQQLRATDPWAALGEIDAPVLLLGMGSSHYANQVAAARLRSRGRAGRGRAGGLRPPPGRSVPGPGWSRCPPRVAPPRPSTPYAGFARPGAGRASWRSPTGPTRSCQGCVTSRSTSRQATSAAEWPAGRSSTRWRCCSRSRSGSPVARGLDSARPPGPRPCSSTRPRRAPTSSLIAPTGWPRSRRPPSAPRAPTSSHRHGGSARPCSRR